MRAIICLLGFGVGIATLLLAEHAAFAGPEAVGPCCKLENKTCSDMPDQNWFNKKDPGYSNYKENPAGGGIFACDKMVASSVTIPPELGLSLSCNAAVLFAPGTTVTCPFDNTSKTSSKASGTVVCKSLYRCVWNVNKCDIKPGYPKEFLVTPQVSVPAPCAPSPE
jgi:hypothetical protein